MVPRALPWALDLLGFQPAQGRRQGFFRTISIYLIFLDFEHPTFSGDHLADSLRSRLVFLYVCSILIINLLIQKYHEENFYEHLGMRIINYRFVWLRSVKHS